MATYYLNFNDAVDGGNDGSYGNPWARFSEVGNAQVLADGDIVIVTSDSNGVSTGSGDSEHALYHSHDITYKAESGKVKLVRGGILNLRATGTSGKKITFDGVCIDGTGSVGRIFDFHNNGTQREAKLDIKGGDWTVLCNSSVEWFVHMSDGPGMASENEVTITGSSLTMLGIVATYNKITLDAQSVSINDFTVNIQATGTHTLFADVLVGTVNRMIIETTAATTAGLDNSTNSNCFANALVDSPSGFTIGNNLLVDPANGNFELMPNSPAINLGSATGTNIPSDAIWVKVSGIATIDGTEGEETNPYGFSEWATVISDANLTTSKSVVFSDGTYTFSAEFSNAYNITDLTFYGETRSGVTLTDGGGRLSGNGGGQNCRLRNLTIEALDHFFFNYTIELDATEVTFLITKYILVSGSNHVFRACVFRVTFSGTSGAWCLSGNTHFTNCTFIDLFGARSSVLTGGSLTNCIIYASLGTQIITMTTPPDESNTIFGIASGFGTANTSNPLFTDPENNNLTLSPRSPLITSTSDTGIPTDAVWIKASGTATVDGTEGQQTNAYGLSELTTAETTASGRTSKTVVFKGEDFSTNAVIRLNTGNTDGMTYLAESDLTIFKATGETARFQVNSESAVKSTLKGITFKDYRTTSGNTYTARVGSDNNSTSLDNAGKVSWISCKFLDFSVTAGFSEIVFGITGTTNPANHCYNECVGCEFSFLSTASQQGGVLGGQNNSKHRMDATGCTFYVKAGTSLTLFISNNNIPEYHLKSCIFYMESGTQVHYYYAALTHSSDGCTYFNSPSQNFTGVTNYRTDDPLLVDKENNNFILSPKSPLLQ